MSETAKVPTLNEYLEAPYRYPELQVQVREALASWRETLIHAAKAMERVPPCAVALAEMGWTMHPDMTPREIVVYSELPQDEVDAVFVRGYFDGATPRIDSLLDGWSRSADFGPWNNLIAEIRTSIQREQYAITIPALLVVLEGYVARVVSREDPKAIKDPNPSRLLKLMAPPRTQSITTAFWVSTAAFMDRLFAYKSFDDSEPSLINRHWILHGRSAANWDRTDAARLVHSIFTMQFLFSDFKVSTSGT